MLWKFNCVQQCSPTTALPLKSCASESFPEFFFFVTGGAWKMPLASWQHGTAYSEQSSNWSQKTQGVLSKVLAFYTIFCAKSRERGRHTALWVLLTTKMLLGMSSTARGVTKSLGRRQRLTCGRRIPETAATQHNGCATSTLSTSRRKERSLGSGIC